MRRASWRRRPTARTTSRGSRRGAIQFCMAGAWSKSRVRTKPHLTEVNVATRLQVSRHMRPLLVMLWATVAVFAADENLVTMALRAQTDFDRVELNYKPSLPETMA